jgi:hypothetical protein
MGKSLSLRVGVFSFSFFPETGSPVFSRLDFHSHFLSATVIGSGRNPDAGPPFRRKKTHFMGASLWISF